MKSTSKVSVNVPKFIAEECKRHSAIKRLLNELDRPKLVTCKLMREQERLENELRKLNI